MSILYAPWVTGRAAAGLLVLRLIVGAALVQHGWTKIQKPFNWMPGSSMPGFLQALAALSEFGGGLALIVGLLAPVAAFGILCTMAVATWTHFSRGDPWVPSGPGPAYELALCYFGVALTLLLTGPGEFSLDALLLRRKSDHSSSTAP